MKGNLCLPNKSQIAREILAYLAEHPSAQDTLDGIVQWWLLERKIKYQMAQVQEALNDLVRSGLVLENKSKNSYQMNLNRLKEAKLLLQRSKTGDGHNERNSEMK